MGTDISDIAKTRNSTELLTTLRGHLRPVVRSSRRQEEAKPLPPIKSASSLLREIRPLPSPIVEGLLHRGSTMVYGGAPKTNKTFALMDMAVSVASGTPWWNLRTTGGKVLYLDFELQEDYFLDRLTKMLDAKGIQFDVMDNLDVWNLRGHAADLSDLTPRIMERIKGKAYSLIIVDPIYKVLGKRDENSAGDVNSLMNELDAIAVKSGAAIVAGHHFSKGNKSNSDAKDRISGSGVFARSPDAIVTITPHEKMGVYTVETTLRNHRCMDPFCVRWEFPLMIRCQDEDPAKLKGLAVKGEQFRREMLLPFLEDGALTTKDWKKNACEDLKMSERTFDLKKAQLVADKQVICGDDKKWRINPVGKPWLKNAILDEVQGAASAIAPVAA